MPILTSSALAEHLNQANRRRGVFFMPFAPHHVDRISIESQEVLVLTDQNGARDILYAQSQMGPAVTGFIGTKPAAVFGFVSIWQGVSEAWLIADRSARAMPMTLTRMGIRVMDIAKISMGLHRVQITVRTTDKRAHNWALAIGFQEECVMRKYGPDGIDYFLMARY